MKKHSLALAVAASVLASAAGAGQIAEVDGVKYSVGGYIKVEGVFNRPDSDATPYLGNSFDATARQSRINFATEREVEGHKVKTFIEGDFYGGQFNAGTTYNWRLRHAYLAVDNVTVGQTWSGAFFATAPMDTPTINFWGLGHGTIAGNGGTIRPDLVLHYTSGPVRLSVQDPVNKQAAYPDLVAAYTQRFKGGSGYIVSAFARDVSLGATQSDRESDLGVGLSLVGKVGMGDLTLHGSVYGGKGVGVFSGQGVGGGYSPSTNTDAEDGELVSQKGFSVGATYKVTDKLKGIARYGKVTVDDTADTDFSAWNATAIYSYMPKLDLGIELRRQDADTLNTPTSAPYPNLRPKGKQLEIMAMYKF